MIIFLSFTAIVTVFSFISVSSTSWITATCSCLSIQSCHACIISSSTVEIRLIVLVGWFICCNILCYWVAGVGFIGVLIRMIVSRAIYAVFIPIVAGFCSGAGLSARSSLLVCKKV